MTTPRRPAVETTLSLQPFSSHLRKVTHPWLPHHDGQAAQAPRSSYRSCGISFTSQVNKVSKSRLSSDNTLLAIKHWVFSSSTKICGLAFHFLSCDHLSSFFSLLGLLRAKHNRDFQEFFVKGDRSLPNRKIFCFYLLWECPTLLFSMQKCPCPKLQSCGKCHLQMNCFSLTQSAWAGRSKWVVRQHKASYSCPMMSSGSMYLLPMGYDLLSQGRNPSVRTWSLWREHARFSFTEENSTDFVCFQPQMWFSALILSYDFIIPKEHKVSSYLRKEEKKKGKTSLCLRKYI